MSAAYQITVLSRNDGVVKNVLTTQQTFELRYSRVHNDVGALALVMPYDQAFADSLQLDDFIEVARTDPTDNALLIREGTYFARSFTLFREDEIDKFAVGGVSLEHLLLRRVVDPADDPAGAGGFSTKAGAADSVIRAYVLEQCVTTTAPQRAFPAFSVPPVAGTADAVGARLRYNNLLAEVQALATRAGLDFYVQRTTGRNLEFRVGAFSKDRRVSTNYPFLPSTIFSPALSNVQQPEFSIDRKDEQNYVYLQGQGQSENRIVFTMSTAAIYDSPYNRVEFSADARNVEKGDALGLQTQAVSRLQEQQGKTTLTFALDGKQPGAVYRQDWDVGDKVTARWNTFEREIRITSVDITLNEAGERISVKVEQL